MERLELDGDVELQDLPLSEVFRRASSVAAQADSFPPGEDTNELFRRGISWFRLASDLIDRLALFSTNEDKDDIPTSDMKYLLTPFYLGELSSGINAPGSPDVRRGAVTEAVAAYSTFIASCDRYGLLGECAAAVHGELEGGMDPQTARAAKIARFKREKALKLQLEEIHKRRMTQLRASALTEEEGDEVAGVDEEDERTAWGLQIELAVQRALDCQKYLKDELQILQHAVGLSEEERAAPPPAPPAELVSELRKVAASLSQDRDKIKAGVFRPGHNLPTMSLRELAEIEQADAMRRQREEAEAAEAQHRHSEECGDDECEEELRRQRAWDDWKDENPRGAGNSKLTPCG